MFHRQSNTIFSITGQIPKKNTVKTCEFVLFRFSETFTDRELEEISQEEVLDQQNAIVIQLFRLFTILPSIPPRRN